MFCIECGTKLKESSKFCSNCGIKISDYEENKDTNSTVSSLTLSESVDKVEVGQNQEVIKDSTNLVPPELSDGKKSKNVILNIDEKLINYSYKANRNYRSNWKIIDAMIEGDITLAKSIIGKRVDRHTKGWGDSDGWDFLIEHYDLKKGKYGRIMELNWGEKDRRIYVIDLIVISEDVELLTFIMHKIKVFGDEHGYLGDIIYCILGGYKQLHLLDAFSELGDHINVEYKSKGENLAYYFCRGKWGENDDYTVRKLSQLGLDFEKENNEGLTPLIYASAYGSAEMVTYLMSIGVNINKIDHQGNNALTYAKKNGHNEVVYLLEARGAELPNQLFSMSKKLCKFLLD